MLRTPNKPQHKTLQNRLQLYHLSLSTYKRTCSNSTAGYWTCAADCCGKGLQWCLPSIDCRPGQTCKLMHVQSQQLSQASGPACTRSPSLADSPRGHVVSTATCQAYPLYTPIKRGYQTRPTYEEVLTPRVWTAPTFPSSLIIRTEQQQAQAAPTDTHHTLALSYRLSDGKPSTCLVQMGQTQPRQHAIMPFTIRV